MSDCGDTSVTELRHSLLNVVKEPVVFDNMITNWEILSWDMEQWASKLGDKKLPFRVGLNKANPLPQWEHECQQEKLTLCEFIKMSNFNDTEAPKQCKKWWYFDYKYMHEWFQEYPEILQTVDWGTLGFPECGGAESTLWLGSKGAHTPCHIDVYGCNLVAQVLGRKQWYLFPPTMNDEMLPTRIPYEESSIFSMHNFYCPSAKITQADLSGVRVVTLNPGQVLFVPRHWWHYVENLDTAISINTWIPLEADDEARVEESLVRLMMAMACKSTTDPQSFLNPNEVDLPVSPLEDTLQLVQISLERHTQNKTSEGVTTSDIHTTTDKLVSTTASKEEKEDKSKIYSTISKTALNIVPTCPVADFQQLLLDKCKNVPFDKSDSEKNCQRTLLEECLNAFCHPTVIAAVRDVLLKTDKQTNLR
ncbi:HSPB1-associated protein 1 isoform X1 [Schistocerca americana]|uniref:HSPB1-associated protein 1 isoform X1 n=1 Tax=Schistocerca americana TaxID=7009 RepID=UPI001F4F2EE2|nr:HSPB1-associated protein 1 isoform X1 [Schistocerca americana]